MPTPISESKKPEPVESVSIARNRSWKLTFFLASCCVLAGVLVVTFRWAPVSFTAQGFLLLFGILKFFLDFPVLHYSSSIPSKESHICKPCEWCFQIDGACHCREGLLDLVSNRSRHADGLDRDNGDGLDVPDFNGTWQLTSISGDFDALMLDAGFNYAWRKAALAANYGIGMAEHAIKQNGNDFTCIVKNGVLPQTFAIKVNGCEQESKSEDGEPIMATPYWSNQALCIGGRRKKTCKDIQFTRRYLADDEYRIEYTTSKGDVVTRHFKRCR